MKILACAEFTEDMASTLYRHFNSYASDGVVAIEVATNGLWLVHPIGTRQFLGLARFVGDKEAKPSGVGIVNDFKCDD